MEVGRFKVLTDGQIKFYSRMCKPSELEDILSFARSYQAMTNVQMSLFDSYLDKTENVFARILMLNIVQTGFNAVAEILDEG